VRFGECAERLCSIASQLLGWRPAEFWQATPAELALALRPPCGGPDGPDARLIAELRARFPDE
jgi:hypothetical protein